MRILYFIHATGREPGNSGIQRVVRNLGAALQALPDVELLPVRWDEDLAAIVFAEDPFRETIRLHGGPVFPPSGHEGEPVHTADDAGRSVLLVPEVPVFGGADPRYPFVHVSVVLGYARSHGIQSACIFYDILPLSFYGQATSSDATALKFIIYANALPSADLIVPISEASGTILKEWFRLSGLPPAADALVHPLLLPEEMVGVPRSGPRRDAAPRGSAAAVAPTAIEFCMWGSIHPHKNQTAVMKAFNVLRRRRPDLNLVLHQFGNVQPRLIALVQREVAKSAGRIRVHGFVDDATVAAVLARCRASVFVSLAEGYGLPVAESLWMGKPCLTSNVAPMTEVANGGGCLLVDPSNIDDIAAGLERLATDGALVARLEQEAITRPLRTWRDYAAALLDLLGREEVVQPSGASQHGDQPASYRPPSVLIETISFRPRDMAVHGDYLGASPSLLQNGDLHFRASSHASIGQDVLCFGPGVELPPGWYEFTVAGQLRGTLIQRVTADQGRRLIAEREVADVDDGVRFQLRGPTQGCEFLLIRTDATEEFVIRELQLNRYRSRPRGWTLD